MTVANTQSDAGATPVELVTVIIDGLEVEIPKGTLIIRAAEQIGIEIPRFCDHPLLEPVGACRQCLVEVATPGPDGSLRPMPKPQTSCTLEATPGMVVRTQNTSPVAEKAQVGMLEFLLINHPLDCPVCDKGGECPLQNQALSHGRLTSRFVDIKRTFPKPLAISTQILLDRERCVLCQRCTRFSQQIAGDPFIDLQNRGDSQQIGTFDGDILGFAGGDRPLGSAELDESGRAFASYFSGNTIQICPVGALTSSMYRFRARPFDLVSTQGIAEHDSCGSAIRVDHRRGVVVRRLAGDDPAVNEEWITDKDRFAFHWQLAENRLTSPLIRDRDEDGNRTDARAGNWVEALELAAEGLTWAKENGGVGVIPGGRLTLEDAYAYSKFARVVLGSNDIDHRTRWSSDEEADFLAGTVAGSGIDVTFTSLETAPAVLVVGLEPEDEAGMVFLRLRKGALADTNSVHVVAPYVTRGTERMIGTLHPAAPGQEAAVLASITGQASAAALSDLNEKLSQPGAVILVGERLALSPGGLSQAAALAERTGAKLAWIPRRAGERGAVEAGTLPHLLPGGRPVADPAARVDVAAVWGSDSLPGSPGRTINEIFQAVIDGELAGLVLGGFEPADLPDPELARRALDAAAFVVSLEVRETETTTYADVVFPVAPPVEKTGTFVNWEGRLRSFDVALETSTLADHRVLHAIADKLTIDLASDDAAQIRTELAEFEAWEGVRVATPQLGAAASGKTGITLATWQLQLDNGSGQDGEPYLRGTARLPVARVNAALAAQLGVTEADEVTVSTSRGAITLPVAIQRDLVDDVVWIPANSGHSRVKDVLGAAPGDQVTIIKEVD